MWYIIWNTPFSGCCFAWHSVDNFRMWPEDGVFVHEIIHCVYDLLYITASFWDQHTAYNFKKSFIADRASCLTSFCKIHTGGCVWCDSFRLMCSVLHARLLRKQGWMLKYMIVLSVHVYDRKALCVCVSLRGQMKEHDALQHNQVLVSQLSFWNSITVSAVLKLVENSFSSSADMSNDLSSKHADHKHT